MTTDIASPQPHEGATEASPPTTADPALPDNPRDPFNPEDVNWNEYDLETREYFTPNSYQYPDVLYYLYWERGLSQAEIAARYDRARQTVTHWMTENDVPTRAEVGSYVGPNAAIGSDNVVHSPRYRGRCAPKQEWVATHRLLACVENDSADVFADSAVVHHETGCSVDNRPDALTVLDSSEHTALHQSGEWIIENGEPRLKLDPDEEDCDPLTEWFGDVDGEDTDEHGLTVYEEDEPAAEDENDASASND